jgi:hypothetical protein
LVELSLERVTIHLSYVERALDDPILMLNQG